MGKSSKKSTKVDAAPAVVAPTKSATKPGKREAEKAIENLASAKKQKKDVAEQKVETKIQNKSKKEETTDEDTSVSESEEEQKVKVAPKKGGKPAKPMAEEDSDGDSSSDEDASVKAGVTSKKQLVATSRNGNVPASKGKLPCSSSDGESSDESESEEDEKPKGKVAAPVKKLPVPSAKNGNVPTKKAEPSDDSESDDSESSDDDEVAAAPKKVENSDSDSDSESEEDEVVVVDSASAPKVVPSKRPPSAAETKTKTVTKAAESDESSSDESSDEEPQMKKMKAQPSSSDDESSEDSSDDEAPKTQMVKKAAPVSKKVSESDEESEEEDSSGEEDTSEEEQPSKTSKKNERYVEMVDTVSPKTNVKPAKYVAQSPVTPQVQTGGPKTLFVGNLSFSVEKTDIENFFKGAGEIVDIRFSFDREGSFRGYGHVEFATVEDALKALELNGRDLLGRNVKLDPAKERGAYTPASGNERSSYQKEGRGQVQTLFIRGFDKSSGLDQVRSALEEHFGTCGEISRLSIQKEYGTDELKGFGSGFTPTGMLSGFPKPYPTTPDVVVGSDRMTEWVVLDRVRLGGYAYMEFTDSDSFNKALELSGSELEGCALTVEEARPRGDSRDSSSSRGGRGRGGRGRDSDRGRGGRGFTRGRGGRDGGRSGGGIFSGGRGRGGPSRLSMATPGTGNKTKFDD
ncbi:hypothetical protein RHMOL_Rhmol09G0098200 [Rhododendron molle]|uniref:Uncharacterized protein n=1 Tax=Rhododendron molle TaxID=49168 RepID=A0ACC0MCZ5_RHOML|nr:hypothetical protein RHMOL_Rhmol09G0098200 [Rhododendron molle]